MQNYTFSSGDAGPLLVHKPKDDENDLSSTDIHAMLLVKKACEQFADEFQQEISEVMYRQVSSKSAGAIAEPFCSKILEAPEPRPSKTKATSRPMKTTAGPSKPGPGANDGTLSANFQVPLSAQLGIKLIMPL